MQSPIDIAEDYLRNRRINLWAFKMESEDLETVFTDNYVASRVWMFFHETRQQHLTKEDALILTKFVKIPFEIACRSTAKEQKKSPFTIAHNPILGRIMKGFEDQIDMRNKQ